IKAQRRTLPDFPPKTVLSGQLCVSLAISVSVRDFYTFVHRVSRNNSEQSLTDM
ncbi:Uncharacterized protein DAT39_011309, partial [Clarias magur]